MVCIASDNEDYIEILYLWNPSIRKLKMLAATPLTRRFASLTHGLAYHSQNNDFKILRLVCYGENEPTVEAEVYTLSTDSWRKVVLSEPDIGSIEEMLQSPFLFFNGALHNLAYYGDQCFILSFDVNDERFWKIMLPQNYYVGFTPDVERLEVFKGLLALIAFGIDLNGIGKCHIWVMREYGVNATGLVLFDPESLNENVLAIEGVNLVDYTANSMESLVLLNDVSSVNDD
uniref:F-box associated beta-propeller type 1 domain-containing protein n=1 Tax=Fagus sylvatica TaxID=28930 RepID=A0A2N9GVE0_FAGSY